MDQRFRRQYLALLATGTTVGVAGCGAGDEEGQEQGARSADGNDGTGESDRDPSTDDDTEGQEDEGVSGGDEETEWVMAHQNRVNNTALETWGPVEEPTVDWHFETDLRVRAAPIIPNDTVYAVVGDGYEGYVYAINKDDGELLWEYETGGVELSTPLYHDGVLYFGGRRFEEGSIPPVEFDGMLYALDAETGAEIWLREDVAGDIIDTPPAMKDGMLYVGSDDGNLYAVNAENGELEWQLSLGGVIKGSPAIVDDVLYVGKAQTLGHAVYAIDLEDESELWELETNEFVTNAPVVSGGTVYIADHLQTYAISAAEGEAEWTYRFDGIDPTPPTESTAAVRDGTVFLTSGGGVSAVDAGDGSEKWSEGVSGAGSPIPGGPVVAGDILYAAAQDLHALDTETGEELWTFDDETVDTDPVVVNGTIYIGGWQGVYALSE